MYRRRIFLTGVILFRTFFSYSQVHPAAVDRVDLVEPRVDAANSRFFFFSSACRPFGMVNLSPDMVLGGTWASGYRYNEDTIKCFSHIHGWELSGIPVLPTTGPFRGQLGPDHYGSSYSHADEVVHPGYHKIVLKDYGITAELTSTMRVGFHRYTFPASSESHILFDFTTVLGSSETDSAVTRRVGDRTLEGHVVMGATARRPKSITVYFVVDFDKPFGAFGGWKDGRIVSVKDSIGGRHTGAYVSFATGKGEVRQMKVAISYVSVAEARNNLVKELPGWDFYRVVKDSRREWNDWLGRIEVEGGTLEEQRRFYTDLWHALQGRRVVSDVSGTYIDMTGQEPRVGHIPVDASGKPRFNHYNSDSYWGAQWSLNTLWGLVYPEVMESFINSMLMMYDDGGLIPRGPSGGNYTYVMTGATTTPFIVSAYMKGIRGFDVRKAYEGMRKDHFPGGMMSKAGYEFNTSSGGGVEYYIKNGYVPYPLSEKKYGLHQDGSAQTLEYAYQDYALAQMAGVLGKKDDYSLFMRRAGNYKNIFLKDSGWMWTRNREGKWNQPVDVLQYEHGWVEGNAAQYTWFVPHDVAGLIRLMGGADKFTEKLNASFQKARTHGFVSGDFKNDPAEQDRLRRVYINYGNQPCMETPFLFNYSGAPWLTQYWTRQLIDSVYSGISPQKGYGGDEDQGLMGALAVLLKTGLFATDGGVSQRPFYEITSPLFRRITIHLNPAYYPGGKLVIEARGNGPGHFYIQRASWNGAPLNKPWLYHADVAKGGTLVLQMGDKPNKSWGSDPAAAPPSMSSGGSMLSGDSTSSGGSTSSGERCWLDGMDLPQFSESVSSTAAGRNAAGDSIRLGGVAYGRGIGVRTTSVLSFFLDGHARRFTAMAGMDDRGKKAPAVRFYVIGDGKILFGSGPVAAGEAPRKVDVDLSGVRRLGLLAIAGDSSVAGGVPGTPGDWADAQLIMERGYVPTPIPNTDEKYILTPASSRTPKINSPKVFGVRPGNPCLYKIATTGERPIRWSARGLPEGLSLDAVTGIITGAVRKRGVYSVEVGAKNSRGEASRRVVFKVGDTIGLTPPMGWNGWNSWARDIDGEKVMASARAMINSGLADHGWSYINVDDAWQGPRGGKYNAIQPNEKFPRFRKMIAGIHAKGLRFGVYSTPWISSYAGYPGGSSDLADGAYPDSIRGDKHAYRRIGNYRFENNDARQMADWGVDYLKYDWRIDLPSAERMADALRQSGRDIFYSLSNSAPFALASDWMRVANSWRTGGDIRDSWISLYLSAFTIDRWGPYGGPGHWNDPDMLIVGNVTTGGKMHPTRLTPDEQYSHVSIFSLEAAPLLIGCPIEQLDAFTLGLLTNDEVIAIDQDPLGKPARLVSSEGGVQVWMRPLEDGSFAVGLFNTAGFGTSPQSYFRWGDEGAVDYTLDLAKLGLKGRWRLRDVWRQKDLGVFDGSYSATIRHHGVVLLRLSAVAAGVRSISSAVTGERSVSAAAGVRGTREVWLDDLAIGTYSEDIRPISLRTSYKSGDSLRIGGHRYGRGLGVQSLSAIELGLNGRASRFMALAGADDGANKEIPLQFYVIGDGRILFASGDRRAGEPPVAVNVDLEGVQRLGLLVRDEVGGTANKRTNGDWADARLVMKGDCLPDPVRDTAARYVLTPPPGKAPRINCARVFGATPGSPFLFTVAATGLRPMRYSVRGLPLGLRLDERTGIISGEALSRGIYRVTVRAKNRWGEASRQVVLKAGDTIALTPPMGWNGWNSWATSIDREKVLASARAMVAKGLRDHGWTYINIDDSWQGQRGGERHALQPNERFPDIGGMVAEIHSLGLKAGLYSTPYIASYGGYPGASSDHPAGGETHATIMTNRRAFNHIGPYRFEMTDARQMGEWGFDFLKYDWRIDTLSAGRMEAALKRSGRDIVFSLSNTAPFEQVKEWARISNMYRTGPDIRDTWNSLYQLVFTIDKWGPYGGPGHWNDPDMMILGNISAGDSMHPTRLTPDEQYSHMSIYCLLAAPLLLGCPIEQLDTFTLGLLTNDEVIAIDQDPLGKPARLVSSEGGVQVWMRPMDDGSFAVGLFNTAGYGETPASYFHWGKEEPVRYLFDLSGAGLKGTWRLRDCWRQQELGVFSGSYSTTIPHHGVVLLRMYPVK